MTPRMTADQWDRYFDFAINDRLLCPGKGWETGDEDYDNDPFVDDDEEYVPLPHLPPMDIDE